MLRSARLVDPSLLVFDDDYSVITVDTSTGRVRHIAGFSDFVFSHDRRLIAGFADNGGHSPETIGVANVASGACLLIPRPAKADDSTPCFSAEDTRLFVERRRFDSDRTVGSLRIITVQLAKLRPQATPRATNAR